MKKSIAVITAALLTLSGCAFESADNTAASGAQEVSSSPAIAEVNSAATEIALEIPENPDEPRREPPQLQVVYSGDGLASCAAMTLGTYTWDTGDSVICVDSIGAVACAAEGYISAVVDLDTAAENEPKINLYGGAEITGAQLFPLEGGVIELSFTPDGVITVPEDIYDGVVCVSAKFPEGEADYFFMVERTLTDPKKPPQLRIFTGDIGFSMTKGAYSWTYTNGDETITDTTDFGSPWNLYKRGMVTPDLSVRPGESLTVMLPEGGEITSAQYWTAGDSKHSLEFSGRRVVMPQEEQSVLCSVTVTMPAGTCDYLFSVNVGETASSPAYEPESTID